MNKDTYLFVNCRYVIIIKNQDGEDLQGLENTPRKALELVVGDVEGNKSCRRLEGVRGEALDVITGEGDARVDLRDVQTLCLGKDEEEERKYQLESLKGICLLIYIFYGGRNCSGKINKDITKTANRYSCKSKQRIFKEDKMPAIALLSFLSHRRCRSGCSPHSLSRVVMRAPHLQGSDTDFHTGLVLRRPKTATP